MYFILIDSFEKSRKNHGLIQAYSRTNRIINELQSRCNIAVFRNLKQVVDEANTLLSNEDSRDFIEVKSSILVQPYEDFVKDFDKSFAGLPEIAPTDENVDDLKDEVEKLEFVKAFRGLIERFIQENSHNTEDAKKNEGVDL